MAEAVRGRLFVSEARVRLLADPYYTLWPTKWNLGFLPVSFIPSGISIHPCVSATLSRRTDARSLGMFQKNSIISETGERKVPSYSIVTAFMSVHS